MNLTYNCQLVTINGWKLQVVSYHLAKPEHAEACLSLKGCALCID
jgi:hypothetical protein